MILTKLMDHQQKIVRFCQKQDQFGIFADYGTGKTLAALAICERLRLKKILVITTKTAVQGTWVDEIRTHTNYRYVVLLGDRKSKIRLLDRGLAVADLRGTQEPVVFLLNFDGVRNIYHEIVAANFDIVVVDESTKIKSPMTLRTKMLWALGDHIKRRGIMTGFPITEDIKDLYAQIKFLRRNVLGKSYYEFLSKYFIKHGVKNMPKRKAVKEIKKLLKPFCIRITNEVLALPPKVYKVVALYKTPEQHAALKQLNDEFRLELGKVKIDTQYIFTLISKSLQICDGFVQDAQGHIASIPTEKDEALLETIEEINVRRNKVVIWAVFKRTIAKLKWMLEKQGYPVLILTGDVDDAHPVVQKFQTSRTHNILIATQKKAAESITLTECRYAIYYSNWWSGEMRGNSEARIRRKGSEKHASIVYIDFLTKGTIEKRVYECLKNKANLVTVLKKEFIELKPEETDKVALSNLVGQEGNNEHRNDKRKAISDKGKSLSRRTPAS